MRVFEVQVKWQCFLSEAPHIFTTTCMQCDRLLARPEGRKMQAEDVFQEMKSKKARF
jgi:hypothetical protein